MSVFTSDHAAEVADQIPDTAEVGSKSDAVLQVLQAAVAAGWRPPTLDGEPVDLGDNAPPRAKYPDAHGELDRQQDARGAALIVARRALPATADAMDLHNLASWIIDGNDPWVIREIRRLAAFITDEVSGEPQRSESAVDTAIRVIRDQARRLEAMDTSAPADDLLSQVQGARAAGRPTDLARAIYDALTEEDAPSGLNAVSAHVAHRLWEQGWRK